MPFTATGPGKLEHPTVGCSSIELLVRFVRGDGVVVAAGTAQAVQVVDALLAALRSDDTDGWCQERQLRLSVYHEFHLLSPLEFVNS
jgi:hypothetical protein